MPGPCVSCGEEIRDGRYCPVCGADQQLGTVNDPRVGTLIADRFRIEEPLSEGGMGRVYRGTQVALERAVAIKFIHSHLASSEEIVKRFMAEARALSALTHPNIVAIFDFGSTNEGDLFMVMELLRGRLLAQVIEDREPMPTSRVGSIIEQVLAGLGEAHEQGIVHRDIKSENVMIEPARGRRERVKLIDFGIARAERSKLTQAGQIAGTPQYIAPEVVQGDSPGPQSDLYAVGVLLFELLTGSVPFDSETPYATLQMQLNADRPDPRDHAPDQDIPAALAEACMRAMAVDPGRRYANADAFADAVADAVRDDATAARLVRPPAPGDSLPAPEAAVRPEDEELLQRAAWTTEFLSAKGALLVWGESGCGRTWLLDQACALLERRGAVVVRLAADPLPLNELSYHGLRRIVSALVGSEEATAPRGVSSLSDPRAVHGIRNIYGMEPIEGVSYHPQETAVAALEWAVRQSVGRAEGRRVVLAIDDVDQLDNASAFPLADVALRRKSGDLLLLMTSRSPPDGDYRHLVPHRELRGWTREQAEDRVVPAALPWLGSSEVLPLYAEQLGRWVEERRDEPPGDLNGIVEARIRSLSKSSLRTLVAVSIAGGVPISELSRMLARPEDLDDSLRPLSSSGFIEVRGGTVQLAHAIYGEITLALAPTDAIADAHRVAAELLAETVGHLELQAHHAIQTDPGFGSFLLVEQAAKRRVELGDVDGGLALLWQGMIAARTLHEDGDELAQSARVVFGRKIAGLLIDVGEEGGAEDVIREVSNLATRDDADRALILELRASVARRREDAPEAARLHSEALRVARRVGDTALVERIEKTTAPRTTGFVRRPSSIVPRHTSKTPVHQTLDRIKTLEDVPDDADGGRG